jgi:hypothetical protein
LFDEDILHHHAESFHVILPKYKGPLVEGLFGEFDDAIVDVDVLASCLGLLH